MRQSRIHRIGIWVLAAPLMAILALWSWNTLAEWAGWPVAEIKHVFAMCVLLLLARTLLLPTGHLRKLEGCAGRRT